MDDARLERIGQALSRIVRLISSGQPLEERLTAFGVVVGQVAYEYEGAEQQAREEGRQAAELARAQEWTTGFLEGWVKGSENARTEAEQEAAHAMAGESTPAEPDATSADGTEPHEDDDGMSEGRPAKESVH
jgi:hypothetical protein